jgi:hypothetical protein
MHNQGGWVGVIALLLVVLIIGFLASGTLKQYGLVPKMPSFNEGAGMARDRDTGSTRADQRDDTPADSMERVRRLQNAVRQQAEEMNERIDRSAK